MGVGGQRHAPVTLPLEKTHNPLYRRLGGPQSRSGWVWNPQTIQPIGSRHTDRAIPAHQTATTMVLKHGGAHVSSTPFQLWPFGMWHNAVQYAGTSVRRSMQSPLSTAPWKWRQQAPQRSFVHLYLPTWQHSIRSQKTVILISLPTHI